MIYKRKTAGGKDRWVVRWRESGRGSSQHERTFDREKDAKRFDIEIRRGKQLGQLAAEVLGSEQTVSDFIDEWFEKYAIVFLKPGTLETYAFVLDKWVLPYLGSMRMRDVTRETIDTFLAGIQAAGAGAPTVNRTRGIIQGIFRRAVEWRRVAANPVAGVRLVPHRVSESIDARTPEDVEAIRAALSMPDAALVSVLAYEGLRPQEAFALEWGDVLEASGRPRDVVLIRRAISGQKVSSTKSSRNREPELFRPVSRDLVELYMKHGRPSRRELVFPAPKGGVISRHNWRHRAWRRALATVWPCTSCTASGRVKERPCRDCGGTGSTGYFRPYDLRHTCATLLIYEGRTLTEVADHLGHADRGVLLASTYAHVFKDAGKRRHVPIADAILTARAAVETQLAGGDLCPSP